MCGWQSNDPTDMRHPCWCPGWSRWRPQVSLPVPGGPRCLYSHAPALSPSCYPTPPLPHSPTPPLPSPRYEHWDFLAQTLSIPGDSNFFCQHFKREFWNISRCWRKCFVRVRLVSDSYYYYWSWSRSDYTCKSIHLHYNHYHLMPLNLLRATHFNFKSIYRLTTFPKYQF